MSITVVGSIAFDGVRTPFGASERMLGGTAVHFGLAASFFDRVHVVGCVGDDFTEADMDVLRNRGVEVGDVERVPGGETFFWRGEYGWDLNTRETLETRLGVFAGFQPKLSAPALSSEVLFLANIQPDLQRAVRAQMPEARFVALDSMDLWIETQRDALRAAIAEVDCVIVNDAELRQLTGKPSLLAAAQAVLELGPRAVVAKQGEYGAALITAQSFFSLPAFPLETVVDPTGAGDTFAGGFIGYLAAHPQQDLGDEALRQAVACGTALASFNVEELGTDRVARLTGGEIAGRMQQLHDLTRFSEVPLPLREGPPEAAASVPAGAAGRPGA